MCVCVYVCFCSDVKASFILMDIEDTKATVYTYSMVSGKLKIDKMDINKS